MQRVNETVNWANTCLQTLQN